MYPSEIIMSHNNLWRLKSYTAHLKHSSKMELSEWIDIVKSGVLKELAPYDPDWYYISAASLARKIYLRKGLGLGAFRRIYRGSKRNGSCPPHFGKSSGSVARHILQQLQNMNIVEMDSKGGRKITTSGQRDLDQVAGRIVVVAPWINFVGLPFSLWRFFPGVIFKPSLVENFSMF